MNPNDNWFRNLWTEIQKITNMMLKRREQEPRLETTFFHFLLFYSYIHFAFPRFEKEINDNHILRDHLNKIKK